MVGKTLLYFTVAVSVSAGMTLFHRPLWGQTSKLQSSTDDLREQRIRLLRSRDNLRTELRIRHDNGEQKQQIDKIIERGKQLREVELELLTRFEADESHNQQAVRDYADRVAGALEMLAGDCESLERFAEEGEVRRDLLALYERLYGKDHWKAVNRRLELAHVQTIQRLAADQRRRLKDADKQTAQSQQLLQARRYSDALSLITKTSETYKELLGEKSQRYARSLSSLAGIYAAMDEYIDAERLYRRALEVQEAISGRTHPDYAGNLTRLADFYSSIGGGAAAEPLYRQSLEAWKAVLGDNEPLFADILGKTARQYESFDNPSQAEPLFVQAAAIRKVNSGEDSSAYCEALTELGLCYQALGKDEKAEANLRQAAEIRKRRFLHPEDSAALDGKSRPLNGEDFDYAFALTTLATVYQYKGETDKAESSLREALQLTEIPLKDSTWLLRDPKRWHTCRALILKSLAMLYIWIDHPDKSDQACHQAIEFIKETVGTSAPDYARTLWELAMYYYQKGRYAEAEPLCSQAVELRKAATGEKHPDYAKGMIDLAAIYHALGNDAKAEPLFKQALQIVQDYLDVSSLVQSERQQLAAAQDLRPTLDLYLSMAPKTPRLAELNYEYVLTWKGTVFSRQRWSRLVQNVKDPALSKTLSELQDVATRLTKLVFSKLDPERQEAWRREIEELTARKEKLESELASRNGEVRTEQGRRRTTPAEVRKALPADAVLIDVLEYTQYSPTQKGDGAKQERRVGAFVIRPDKPIVQLNLGPAADIASAVDEWRKGFGGKTAEGVDPSTELRRLVWKPLEEYIRGCKIVLFSPDGPLASFPFAALPGEKQGSYLIEEQAIAIVPVPQLLPELLADCKEANTDNRPPTMLLLGNVNFDAAPKDSRPSSNPTAAQALQRSGIGAMQTWVRLDGTGDEVVAIAAVFRRVFHGTGLKMLSDDEASKAVVLAETPKHAYLHLATHGFFAPPTLLSALAPRNRHNLTTNDAFGRPIGTGIHPGLLSGLVLAGANRASNGGDDGILTALEVAELDLHQSELVVLSACETGLGAVSGGEGILGLQRAFQVGGARSVVASLWGVNDDATQTLMVEFYKNLWEKKLSKLESLRQAQLTMLRQYNPKEGGLRGVVPRNQPKLSDKPDGLMPYYWAAFVLSGDWR